MKRILIAVVVGAAAFALVGVARRAPGAPQAGALLDAQHPSAWWGSGSPEMTTAEPLKSGDATGQWARWNVLPSYFH